MLGMEELEGSSTAGQNKRIFLHELGSRNRAFRRLDMERSIGETPVGIQHWGQFQSARRRAITDTTIGAIKPLGSFVVRAIELIVGMTAHGRILNEFFPAVFKQGATRAFNSGVVSSFRSGEGGTRTFVEVPV